MVNNFFTHYRQDIRLFTVISIVILVDQITKVLVRNSIELGQSKNILTGFLTLTNITNTGAGFGILQGMNLFLIIIGILIIIILLYYYHHHKTEEEIPGVFFALVLGGAFGNLIDRIIFGSVTDFISFSFWPAFNVADGAITLGVISLILFYIKQKK
jgi:signal peptidase II